MDIRERLAAHIVKTHRVELPLTGVNYFRDPSGADWIRVLQLMESMQRAGNSTVPRYLFVPILLCKESGALEFPDYQEGVNFLQTLKADALAELGDACFDRTGLGELLSRGAENAEKKS